MVKTNPCVLFEVPIILVTLCKGVEREVERCQCQVNNEYDAHPLAAHLHEMLGLPPEQIGKMVGNGKSIKLYALHVIVLLMNMYIMWFGHLLWCFILEYITSTIINSSSIREYF